MRKPLLKLRCFLILLLPHMNDFEVNPPWAGSWTSWPPKVSSKVIPWSGAHEWLNTKQQCYFSCPGYGRVHSSISWAIPTADFLEVSAHMLLVNGYRDTLTMRFWAVKLDKGPQSEIHLWEQSQVMCIPQACAKHSLLQKVWDNISSGKEGTFISLVAFSLWHRLSACAAVNDFSALASLVWS